MTKNSKVSRILYTCIRYFPVRCEADAITTPRPPSPKVSGIGSRDDKGERPLVLKDNAAEAVSHRFTVKSTVRMLGGDRGDYPGRLEWRVTICGSLLEDLPRYVAFLSDSRTSNNGPLCA